MLSPFFKPRYDDKHQLCDRRKYSWRSVGDVQKRMIRETGKRLKPCQVGKSLTVQIFSFSLDQQLSRTALGLSAV